MQRFVALALLLGTLAGAQHSGHTMPGMTMPGNMPGMPMPMPGTPAPVPVQPGDKITPAPGGETGSIKLKMSMEMMGKQMVAALAPLQGRAFDIRFAQLMIEHHLMADAMAVQELRLGKDERVKAQAREVSSIQHKEILIMGDWLQKWTGKPYPLPTAHLMKPEGSVDRWFLTEMIPHHQGGIDMSRLAATHASSPELKKLAASIIGVQAAQIKTYQTLLKTVK